MKDAAQRNELGDFLRARRADIRPQDVGLPTGGQRRVQGLRREEVAVLSAISTDYYTRLEQGRMQASPSVLAALGRVLQLNEDQRDYLYGLAARDDYVPPRRRPRQRGREVASQLERMLDDMQHTPAFVIGPRTEVVAWNAMGAALVTDFAAIKYEERFYIRMLITDPRMRELYADWEGVTRLSIAQMRMHNAANPSDPVLARLVGELSLADEQFRRWWADHDVAVRDSGAKLLRHPVVGDLHLDWSAVTWGADPDLQMIVWTAEAGTPTHDSLRLLASWAASEHLTSSAATSRT